MSPQHSRFRSTRTAVRASAAVVSVAVAVMAGAGEAQAAPAPAKPACPALFALGVQGTGESSPDAATTTDTGMLSAVFRPLIAEAKGLVDRAYVPYFASFGGVTSGGPTPYAQSIQDGLGRLTQMATQELAKCPNTQLAVAGYSQGAHVVSLFAQQIGQGNGAIPAEKVAAVALFGDPTRAAGASLFPGAPGKTIPDAAPGTKGAAVSRVAALAQPPLDGGGIGPQRDQATNFGSLTGRVASFCIAGDLSCDAPEHAPLMRVVSNIIGQSELSGGDPIRSILSVGQALAFTAIKVATGVVNDDVQGSSLSDLQFSPQESISERLAEASDPRSPLDLNSALQAVIKIGTIGLNSIITIATTVLTPANIASLAAVGLTNPVAALGLFGTQLLGALPQLVPPTTVIGLVQGAFAEVSKNLTDNSDLLNAATWTKYSDTIRQHGAYIANPIAAGGAAPVKFIADWFSADAHDLAGVSAANSSSTADSGGFGFDDGSGGGALPWSGTTSTNSSPSATAVPGTDLPWGAGPSSTTSTPTTTAPIPAPTSGADAR